MKDELLDLVEYWHDSYPPPLEELSEFLGFKNMYEYSQWVHSTELPKHVEEHVTQLRRDIKEFG